MSNDPNGFGENPQTPMSDDENVIDESIWGPQKILTPEEQADYDAWLTRKVSATMEKIRSGKAEFYTHDEVMAHAEDLLDRLDREAGLK